MFFHCQKRTKDNYFFPKTMAHELLSALTRAIRFVVLHVSIALLNRGHLLRNSGLKGKFSILQFKINVRFQAVALMKN